MEMLDVLVEVLEVLETLDALVEVLEVLETLDVIDAVLEMSTKPAKVVCVVPTLETLADLEVVLVNVLAVELEDVVLDRSK